MARRSLIALVCWLGVALAPTSAQGQTIRGEVLDGTNGHPVSLAGVSLLDRDRDHIVVAMTDSLGRYVIPVPGAGEYFLVAQRFGYTDMTTPLLAVSEAVDYDLDLEMRPEPLGLEGVRVTVRNEEVTEWLTREFGSNPAGMFGFRLLQGERLAEAKARGGNRTTETLRWLYVPVSHGLRCVSINSVPRAKTVGSRGLRQSVFAAPGAPPVGTVDPETLSGEGTPQDEDPNAGCGVLMVDDRVVPNEHLDRIDMRSVAVVITLPDMVRMYTYGFDWSFRR